MASVRSRPVVIALVAILAIALAAATLTTAVSHGGPAGGGGLGDGDGDGPRPDVDRDAGPVGFPGFGGTVPLISLPCYPVLNEWWFLAGGTLVASTGLSLLYRSKGPLVPLAVVAAVGPLALFVHALLTGCRAARDSPVELAVTNWTSNGSGFIWAGSGGGGPAAGGPSLASVVLIGVLSLALLGAVALLLQATGDDAPPTSPETGPDARRMAAIGRAAGRAAERIEGDAETDNAVYRSWEEMTDLLEVPNPAASTPTEFADAAVEAGLDAEDVDELTSLFEAVRYGTASPTEAREARAVAALRRIEDAHAGEAP